MRKFSTATVSAVSNFRSPLAYNRPGYFPAGERVFVMFNDGDGWEVFVEVDNKTNADLIVKALNKAEMRKDVKKARAAIKAANEPNPPTLEERVTNIEAQLNES